MTIPHKVYQANIDTVRISGLACKFQIKRNLKQDPNTAEISFYNCSEATQQKISKPGVTVQFLAGYDNTSLSEIYLGQLTTAQTKQEGPDSVTTVNSGDGKQAMRAARVNATLGKGKADPKAGLTIAADAMKSLGIGSGNLASAATKFDSAVSSRFSKLGKVGMVMTGSANEQMQMVAESAGFEVSVQCDKLQVLERGKPLAGIAIVLSPSTGLIGSPTVETKGKDAGRMKAKCRMIPDMAPGRIVTLQSRYLSGNFRVETCVYTGDTHGTSWDIDIEGSPY